MTDVGVIALKCIHALESAGIPCAIGGAIALGFWSVPRATLDVDLNLFVEAPDAARALAPLYSIGATGDFQEIHPRLLAGDAAILRIEGVRLDVFLPSIPFYATAAERVQRVPFLGSTVPVLSAETIAVFKLLFFRRKDIVDLERLVAFRGEELDHRWVRRQVAEMLGDDDERIQEWDRITREYRGEAPT